MTNRVTGGNGSRAAQQVHDAYPGKNPFAARLVGDRCRKRSDECRRNHPRNAD